MFFTESDVIVISDDDNDDDDDEEEDDNWQSLLDNLDLKTIGNDWDKEHTGLVENIYDKLRESRKRRWGAKIVLKTRPLQRKSKRLVVIDASNVAHELVFAYVLLLFVYPSLVGCDKIIYHFSYTAKENFNVDLLESAIDYFESRDHAVVAIAPAYRYLFILIIITQQY